MPSVVPSLPSSISIPAPARGRTGFPSPQHPQMLFQFPPPRGGEPPGRGARASTYYFNSRPREGANPARWLPAPASSISIPAPARGRTQVGVRAVRLNQFQFPPPRGGEHRLQVIQGLEGISIPAPARGRTQRPWRWAIPDQFQFPPPRGGELSVPAIHFTLCSISIPAPARGRTQKARADKGTAGFQFPPPRGGERWIASI